MKRYNQLSMSYYQEMHDKQSTYADEVIRSFSQSNDWNIVENLSTGVVFRSVKNSNIELDLGIAGILSASFDESSVSQKILIDAHNTASDAVCYLREHGLANLTYKSDNMSLFSSRQNAREQNELVTIAKDFAHQIFGKHELTTKSRYNQFIINLKRAGTEGGLAKIKE